MTVTGRSVAMFRALKRQHTKAQLAKGRIGVRGRTGKLRMERAVAGSARSVLIALDRLDDCVLPVAGRVLGTLAARTLGTRAAALGIRALGIRALGIRVTLGARTGDVAGGAGGFGDASVGSRSDSMTPYGDRCDPVVEAAADRAVVDAGQGEPHHRPAEPHDAAAVATTARRGLHGSLVVERSMRVMVLGAVSVIGVSAISALARGPAGGRDLEQVGRPLMVVPAVGEHADPAAGPVSTMPGAPAVVTAAAPGTVPAPVAVPVPVEEMPAAAVLVGPGPRETVGGYLEAARMRLAASAQASGQPDTYAVVSFPGYRTPEQALGLLQGLRTVRVFFRVPPDGTALSADVRDPLADVRTAFAHAADAAAAQADAVGAVGDADARERAVDEAAALRDSCACLYGAVVVAPAWRLLALAEAGSVRLADVAPPGVPGPSAVFVPLRPEQW